MRRLLIISFCLSFLISVLFVGCGRNKQHTQSDSVLIEVDVADIQPLLYSTVFQLKDVVQFDPSEIVVANIEKAVLFGDYIIVKCFGVPYNLIAKNLATGKLVKIGRKGKGPGEYQKASDFLIDEVKAEIWVLDGTVGKILSYSLDGELQNERMNDAYRYAQSFYKLEDNKVALYYGTSLFGDGNHRVQILETEEGQVLREYIEVKENESRFMNFLEAGNFTKRGLFHYKYHHSLYKIDDFEEAYQISFKEKTLPAEVLDKNFNDVREFVEYCRATSYAHGVTNIIEMSNRLLFSFVYNGDMVNCIYNLDAKEYVVYNENRNDVFGLGQSVKLDYMNLPRGGDENTLIFEVEPAMVKVRLEKLKGNLPKDQWDALYADNREWIDLIDTLPNNTNSLLALVEFKN